VLILDGHNVLFAMLAGAKPAGPDALEAAETRLVESLLRHYNATGERATIVFDSRRLRGGARCETTLAGVRVRYAHPPDTADDEIRRLVAASTAPKHLRVVTSDGELMRACAERGAAVVPSRVFVREMRREAERAARDDEERRLKTSQPSPEEMRELLAAFGEAEAPAPPPPRRPPQPRKPKPPSAR